MDAKISNKMDAKTIAKELHNIHLVSLIKTIGCVNVNYKETAKQSALVTLSYLTILDSINSDLIDDVKKQLLTL